MATITPPHLRGVLPEASWDTECLYELDLPVTALAIGELTWLLDQPLWSSPPPEPLFDLAPRDVMRGAVLHAEHTRRIDDADLSLPLLVTRHAGRWVTLDGLHRLVRYLQEDRRHVLVHIVPRSLLDD